MLDNNTKITLVGRQEPGVQEVCVRKRNICCFVAEEAMLMRDELHRIANGAVLFADEFKRIISRPKPISALVLVNKILVRPNNHVINVCLRKILNGLMIGHQYIYQLLGFPESISLGTTSKTDTQVKIPQGGKY